MQSENIKTLANATFTDPVIPPMTEILKKSKLRDELEKEVQKYLAKNRITELKTGETCYPDGKIPLNRNKGNFNETSNEIIAKKNSGISQTNAKKTQNEIKGINKNKRPVLTKQKISNSDDNAKKPTRLRKQPNRSPEQTAEIERKREIIRLRTIAEAQGLTEFIAPCKLHGMTKYHLKSNGTRCGECNAEHRKKRIGEKDAQQILNLKRKTENRERLAKAVAEQKEEFEAECINCGLTTFKIKRVLNSDPPKHTSYCKHCTSKCFKAVDLRRSQQRKEERLQKN